MQSILSFRHANSMRLTITISTCFLIPWATKIHLSPSGFAQPPAPRIHVHWRLTFLRQPTQRITSASSPAGTSREPTIADRVSDPPGLAYMSCRVAAMPSRNLLFNAMARNPRAIVPLQIPAHHSDLLHPHSCHHLQLVAGLAISPRCHSRLQSPIAHITAAHGPISSSSGPKSSFLPSSSRILR